MLKILKWNPQRSLLGLRNWLGILKGILLRNYYSVLTWVRSNQVGCTLEISTLYCMLVILWFKGEKRGKAKSKLNSVCLFWILYFQFPKSVKSLETFVFCVNSSQTILTQSQFIWERSEDSSWPQTQRISTMSFSEYQENVPTSGFTGKDTVPTRE